MAALLEERELTDDDRAGMGAIGDAPRPPGHPARGDAAGVRFTIDEVFNGLWEAAEHGAVDSTQVVHLTRKIWHYADPMMDVAIQAYRARERIIAVAEGQDRTALVHRLLLTPGGEDDVDLVSGIGLDPTAEYVALRARSRGDLRELLLSLGTQGALEGGARRAARRRRHRVRATPTRRRTTGLDRRSRTSWPAARSPAVAEGGLASGRDRDGVRALRRAHHRRARDGGDRAHRDDDRRAPRGPVHRALRDRETPQGRELLETVQALTDHELSVERAAEHLFVHTNTVRNRPAPVRAAHRRLTAQRRRPLRPAPRAPAHALLCSRTAHQPPPPHPPRMSQRSRGADHRPRS